MDPSDLIGLIAWRRELLGKSQSQLGAESGTGQATISRLEQGRVDVRLGTLREISRALAMDVRVVPHEVLAIVDSLIQGVTAREEDGSDHSQPLYRLEDDSAGHA